MKKSIASVMMWLEACDSISLEEKRINYAPSKMQSKTLVGVWTILGIYIIEFIIEFVF